MTELEELKFKIKTCFYKFVITDPYPDHSEHEQHVANLGLLDKIFKTRINIPEPPKVSIHKAWTDGFNFAKKLVNKELS